MIKAFFEIDTWSLVPNELHVVCFPGDMQTIIPHWQASPEILLVLEGSLDVTVSDHTYHLEQYDFITINSNEIHSISDPCKDGTQLILTIDEALFHSPGLRFLFSTVEENAIPWDHPDAWAARSCIANMAYANHKRVGIIREPGISADRSAAEGWYELRSCLYKLLELMTKYTIQEPSKVQQFPALLIECLTFIHTNYQQSLTAEDVAKKMYISRAKLFRLFATHIGVGFSEYLNMVRVQQASAQLLETRLSIAEIAEGNGFNALSNFYGCFKKMMGTTPHQYRQMKKIGDSTWRNQEFRFLNQFGRRTLSCETYKRYISFFETISKN